MSNFMSPPAEPGVYQNEIRKRLRIRKRRGAERLGRLLLGHFLLLHAGSGIRPELGAVRDPGGCIDFPLNPLSHSKSRKEVRLP